METGQSWGDFTIVHINHSKSSHAVKVWTAAKQQTDHSLSVLFRLKNHAAWAKKCALFSPTQSTKIFTKISEVRFKTMITALSFNSETKSLPKLLSTQLTAATSWLLVDE